MRFPEAMRSIMRARGATQASLAEALGIRPPSIAGALAKGNPSIDACHRYVSEMGYRVALVPEGARLPEGSYLLDPMRGE